MRTLRVTDIHRVLVIGSGTMGLQIGLQVATHDYNVVLYDADPAALDGAPERLHGYGEAAMAAGSIDADALERALARIEFMSGPAAAAAGADMTASWRPTRPSASR